MVPDASLPALDAPVCRGAMDGRSPTTRRGDQLFHPAPGHAQHAALGNGPRGPGRKPIVVRWRDGASDTSERRETETYRDDPAVRGATHSDDAAPPRTRRRVRPRRLPLRVPRGELPPQPDRHDPGVDVGAAYAAPPRRSRAGHGRRRVLRQTRGSHPTAVRGGPSRVVDRGGHRRARHPARRGSPVLQAMAGAVAGPGARDRQPKFTHARHGDEAPALRGTRHPRVLGFRSGGQRGARRAARPAAHRRPIRRCTAPHARTGRDPAADRHQGLLERRARALPVR